MSFIKQFGGKISKADALSYERSTQWWDSKFHNLSHVNVTGSVTKLPRILYKQFAPRDQKRPSSPIPIIPFDLKAILAPSERTKMIWYGHSALMLRMSGQTILIDPMLGPDVTPIAPTTSARFSEDSLSLIRDFPQIDLILITHDHYDHLDMASINQLKAKTKKYIVSMGVKRHLTSWGVDPRLIQEVDWYDTLEHDHISVTFTPTQHFSGRGLTDRQQVLWGGWLLDDGQEKIWFSGDGGYGDHFLEIGKRFGPIDFGMMECGQYNDDWPEIHLFPEDSVKAAKDAGVKKAMPVHWGGFDLSYQHTWYDPVEDFQKHARQYNLDYCIPQIGQLFTTEESCTDDWWAQYK